MSKDILSIDELLNTELIERPDLRIDWDLQPSEEAGHDLMMDVGLTHKLLALSGIGRLAVTDYEGLPPKGKPTVDNAVSMSLTTEDRLYKRSIAHVGINTLGFEPLVEQAMAKKDISAEEAYASQLDRCVRYGFREAMFERWIANLSVITYDRLTLVRPPKQLLALGMASLSSIITR